MTVVIVLCVAMLRLLELYSVLNVCSLCYINYIADEAAIKEARIKQRVEEDAWGPFLMLLKFCQEDSYLCCIYLGLALVWCRKIASFSPGFLFERLLDIQCIYFRKTNCFRFPCCGRSSRIHRQSPGGQAPCSKYQGLGCEAA